MEKKVVNEAVYYIYNDESFDLDDTAVLITGKVTAEEIEQIMNDTYLEIYGGGFTGA